MVKINLSKLKMARMSDKPKDSLLKALVSKISEKKRKRMEGMSKKVSKVKVPKSGKGKISNIMGELKRAKMRFGGGAF